MTCGAHTASQPWRRHRRARDTCPETPDINRATSRAPRALSCTYTFDPVQWVGTCKRNRPEPTKHALTMMLARVPSSLARVSKMTKSGHPFPIWQLRPTPPPHPPSAAPMPFSRLALLTTRAGGDAAVRSATRARHHRAVTLSRRPRPLLPRPRRRRRACARASRGTSSPSPTATRRPAPHTWRTSP